MKPSAEMPTASTQERPHAESRLRDFYELTKPRMNFLVVITTAVGYYMAAQGILIAFVIVGLLSARWLDRRDARRAAGV